jgi:asparagine synthase (glutamine-hydrolysing)
MCGIAGILNYDSSDLGRLVSEMIGAISYRGPDDSGVWFDERVGIAFGHARLSRFHLAVDMP